MLNLELPAFCDLSQPPDVVYEPGRLSIKIAIKETEHFVYKPRAAVLGAKSDDNA